MNRLRIKFEDMSPGNKYHHEGQFMIDTDEEPEKLIERVKEFFAIEHAKANKRFSDELHGRYDMIRTIIRNTDADKLDLSCIGRDISTEEFFENEIRHEFQD